MTARTDALAQAIFQKPTLQECSRQQVDHLAHQYPYFNAAQLLRLQKTEAGTGDEADQWHRAGLQVMHPLQLHYWLHPEDFETEMPPIAELFQKPISETEVVQADMDEEPDDSTAPELPATNSAVGSTPDEVEQTGTEQTAALAGDHASEEEAALQTPLAFEPFHTVDYFASQGIKLSQQEAVGDKLGKQLKSFTEWLRTMKRLPEATVAPLPAAGERNVENLAAHSLDTADVVTESMAEVWLKQGAKEKAVEVYRKLSLRDPAKNAYFAAKIEALK